MKPRPIAFREWLPQEKKFRMIFPMHPNETVQECHILHSYNLQQFTGLKDKNGKKIFEGDYLKADDDDIFKVQFEYGAFVIEFDDGSMDNLIGIFPEDCCEIIGNVWENPELLNESH